MTSVVTNAEPERGSGLGWGSAGGFGGALAAAGDAAEGAHETDEGSAHVAWIAFGGPLFSAAGAAGHAVVLVDLGHARSGGEVVALDLVDQRGARDPELDGRAGAVAGVVLEGALDVLALEVLQAHRRGPPVADPGPCA